MVSDVVAAVSNAIYNEFGSDYRIYADNVEQKLIRPCFFINVLRPIVDEQLMGRSRVTIPFAVQYFPSTQGKRTECYDVGDRLMHCLAYPEYDEVMYRGTGRTYEIVDDKLDFRVRYKFFTIPRDQPGVETSFGDYQAGVNTKREDEA